MWQIVLKEVGKEVVTDVVKDEAKNIAVKTGANGTEKESIFAKNCKEINKGKNSNFFCDQIISFNPIFDIMAGIGEELGK